MRLQPLNRFGRWGVFQQPANGSGKTDALTSLVKRFAITNTRQMSALRNQNTYDASSQNMSFTWAADGPARVIVQTFSPFTRFPAPLESGQRLLDLYQAGDVKIDEYISVGLHKSYRNVAGNVARKVLEESLYRLSESSESVKSIFGVMDDLEFERTFKLIYRPKPSAQAVFKNATFESVLDWIDRRQDDRRFGVSATRLRREIGKRQISEVAEVIFNSISIVNSEKKSDLKIYELIFNFENAKEYFHMLQAYALLRRLDLISLAGCEIKPRWSKRGYFDISEASSGEQQMLCSIFGIASSIRRNSLVLIDEPELSLHPKRQMEYVDALVAIMKQTEGCHVFVSTHSPIIVQAAQNLGAGITQLGDTVANALSTDPGMQVSVEQALVDVFRTPIPNSSHVSNQIFKAIVQAETGGASEQEAAKGRLRTLQAIYNDGEGSSETRQLLMDAFELVENSAQDADEDDESVEPY
jgi:hypothetical protein